MQNYVSIIVPVYKVEGYLDECVHSLLSQGLPNDQYEVILVDDGSPDSCGEICDAFAAKHKNVRSCHKKNGGLSDARNYGLKLAKGKYILFVDSDDYIESNSLEKIVSTCIEQEEPDILFLQARKKFSGDILKDYDDPMDISELKKDKHSVLSYLSNRTMYPASAWSKMIKKKLLEEYDIFFKVNQLSEDYEWSLALYLNAKSFGAYNGSYYYYRQNRSGSITASTSEKHFLDLLGIINNFKEASVVNTREEAVILSFAAYIYRTMLWYAPKYYKNYKSEIIENRYLLEKRNSKDVRIIRHMAKIVGIGGVVRLLTIYGRLRN